jgi:hypothetical protein
LGRTWIDLLEETETNRESLRGIIKMSELPVGRRLRTEHHPHTGAAPSEVGRLYHVARSAGRQMAAWPTRSSAPRFLLSPPSVLVTIRV